MNGIKALVLIKPFLLFFTVLFHTTFATTPTVDTMKTLMEKIDKASYSQEDINQAIEIASTAIKAPDNSTRASALSLFTSLVGADKGIIEAIRAASMTITDPNPNVHNEVIDLVDALNESINFCDIRDVLKNSFPEKEKYFHEALDAVFITIDDAAKHNNATELSEALIKKITLIEQALDMMVKDLKTLNEEEQETILFILSHIVDSGYGHTQALKAASDFLEDPENIAFSFVSFKDYARKQAFCLLVHLVTKGLGISLALNVINKLMTTDDKDKQMLPTLILCIALVKKGYGREQAINLCSKIQQNPNVDKYVRNEAKELSNLLC